MAADERKNAFHFPFAFASFQPRRSCSSQASNSFKCARDVERQDASTKPIEKVPCSRNSRPISTMGTSERRFIEHDLSCIWRDKAGESAAAAVASRGVLNTFAVSAPSEKCLCTCQSIVMKIRAIEDLSLTIPHSGR